MNLVNLMEVEFIFGCLLIFGNDIKNTYIQILMRKRLKYKRKSMSSKSKLYNFLNMVFQTVLGLKIEIMQKLISVAFIIIVGVCMINFTLIKSIIIAFSIVISIWIIILMKFYRIRKQSSYAGEFLMINFLNQYRISKYNIYETLENLSLSKNSNRKINKMIKKLLIDIRNASNSEKIKDAADEFSNVIDTNWSRMFAYNIMMSASKGWNITMAIEDILVQLKDAKILEEERKRMNSEAVRIISYMIPVLYLLTIVLSIEFSGLTLKEFINNQFFNKEGFTFFIVNIIVFLFNIAIVEVSTNKKFDY